MHLRARLKLNELGKAESRQRRSQLAHFRIGQPVPCFPQIATPRPRRSRAGQSARASRMAASEPRACEHGAPGAFLDPALHQTLQACDPRPARTITPSRSQHRHRESAPDAFCSLPTAQQPPHCRPASVAGQGTRRDERRLAPTHTHVGMWVTMTAVPHSWSRNLSALHGGICAFERRTARACGYSSIS